MTTTDYNQKKRECWEEFTTISPQYKAFSFAFNRAYALGKQEKDAEGEEMLMVSRTKIEALHSEIHKAIMDAHDTDDWQDAAHYILDILPRSFNALFGSKCLPDEKEFAENANCKEPKPSEPTDQPVTDCHNFDTILKDSFRDHNRLHIAAMAMQGILSNAYRMKQYGEIAMHESKNLTQLVARNAMRYADTLIAESEKGGIDGENNNR